jgi:DNA mismatch endonuclease (patch repair protein)
MPRWEPTAPQPAIWKAPPTRAERAAEQDRAAGSRANRRVELADGRAATASISLQAFKKSRKIYAYLRYKAQGRTNNRYVGDATAQTREEALAIAWAKARGKNMLG